MYFSSFLDNNNFPHNGNNIGDTTLRLDGFGYGTHENTAAVNKETDTEGASSNAVDDGCKLVLGLGPTLSSYSHPFSTSSCKGISSLHRVSILQLGLSGSVVNENSNVVEFSDSRVNVVNPSGSSRLVVQVDDEGSTSAKKSGGYMTKLVLAPKIGCPDISLMGNIKSIEQHNNLKSHCQVSQLSPEPLGISTFSCGGTTSEPGSTTISSSDRKTTTTNSKKCKFPGCTKGARGATALCIGHGGGQRCLKPGCNKGAESRTAFCKAHGGGRRCQYLGCTKSAEGKTDHCIAHGGGRRCGFPQGCTKAARGKSGLCIKHGGGERCKVPDCNRSAEGQIGLCISHGGGRRCQYPSCNKGAQGSTKSCKAHGGGKRCIFAGCNKGAEGSTPLCKGHGGGKRCMFDGGGICPKSVHGGTNFCVAHGGGKRCAVPGCTKSARGKTSCCVRHGGGKRCKFENCDKSAQGSTDFCKAHGGGKRCSWAEEKCEKFARGKSGLCAAHTSLVQGPDTNKRVMIGPGLFRGLVPCNAMSSYENTGSSSGLSILSDSIDSFERSNKRQKLIPPQVLVPLSMKSSFSEKRVEETSEQVSGERKGLEFSVPEGRVHGGGLLSLLRGDLNNAVDGI